MDLVVSGVTALIALVALVVAIFAKRDSAISAKAAQESAAEARRSNDRLEAADRAGINAEIRRGLRIEERDDHFRFVNDGDRPVAGVEVVDVPEALVGVPNRFETLRLQGGRSAGFQLSGGRHAERPEFLMVRWDGLEEPVPIEFPYDVMKSIL
ncbi:MAG: hypothetical protein CVT65_11070 [Actinobacteria bacterium HGW-Actinobacteria-5]|jgi:hypothetical protein|nr:MAG: hypothetical protein CVT65_11070 [Actinobacteria bacterium HGW-Actinobacteria-5]